jgi:hypothetical protein
VRTCVRFIVGGEIKSLLKLYFGVISYQTVIIAGEV